MFHKIQWFFLCRSFIKCPISYCEKTEETSYEKEKNVFIASIDFFSEKVKRKKEKKIQDVDRRKQRKRRKTGKIIFHNEIHHC